MDLTFGFVLGIVASGIAAIVLDYITRPKLEATIDPTGRVRRDQSSQPAHEFHHLLVRNKRAPLPFLARKPAWSVKASLEVFDACGTAVTGSPIDVRWTSQPEPLAPSVMLSAQVNLLDPAKLVTGRKVDIHAHEDQQVSLLLKYEGEDDCYVFSNESYRFPSWQHPNWRIPLGEFRVLLSIYYERGRVQQQFSLLNRGSSLADVHVSQHV